LVENPRGLLEQYTEMPRGGSEAAKLGYGEEHDQAIQMRSLD
jgi:hypothetical protein